MSIFIFHSYISLLNCLTFTFHNFFWRFSWYPGHGLSTSITSEFPCSSWAAQSKTHGWLEAWLMNAFCRKLFRDNHPRKSNKHFFFNTTSVSYLFILKVAFFCFRSSVRSALWFPENRIIFLRNGRMKKQGSCGNIKLLNHLCYQIKLDHCTCLMGYCFYFLKLFYRIITNCLDKFGPK
jgi:hypothetical protein